MSDENATSFGNSDITRTVNKFRGQGGQGGREGKHCSVRPLEGENPYGLCLMLPGLQKFECVQTALPPA